VVRVRSIVPTVISGCESAAERRIELSESQNRMVYVFKSLATFRETYEADFTEQLLESRVARSRGDVRDAGCLQ